MPRTIVISGASSGIGRALALHYANAGVGLGLLGRDKQRLAEVADACRARGSDVRIGIVDVRDRGAIENWLDGFDREYTIDLLIANAGVMEGTPPGGEIEPADAAYRLIEINVLGVMNCVQPAVARMMQRGGGQVAIISSIAAFTPLADSPSYCASKSAVLNYGLSLRALLAARGVRVNVVCPGYIDTPMMSREHGPKPFRMSADRAARLIDRGLRRDHAVIAFPAFFAWVTWISGLLPDGVRRWTARSFRFTVSEREP
jgi:short-subunit dehydrogenase